MRDADILKSAAKYEIGKCLARIAVFVSQFTFQELYEDLEGNLESV